MWRTLSLAAWLTACSFIPLPGEEITSQRELCPVPIGPESSGYASVYGQPPHFRDTQYGQRPRFGAPCGPTEGHLTYEVPSRHFGHWFRPASFAEETGNHCGSRPWIPRGKGWANRHTGFQMDYHPYVVTQLPSVHGPAYYHREDPRPCNQPFCCKGGQNNCK
jgi:hypothetical protein